MKIQYKPLNIDTYKNLRRRSIIKFENTWDNIPEPGNPLYVVGCVHTDKFYLKRSYPSWTRIETGSVCSEHGSRYKIQRDNLPHSHIAIRLTKRGKPFIARRLKT